MSCLYWTTSSSTNYIGELKEGYDIGDLGDEPTLEELFDQEKPTEMSDEEEVKIKHILR
jgi:hypothetical protein